MSMARRFDGMGHGYDGTTRRTSAGTDWTGEVHLHEDRLSDPLEWAEPRFVFVDSMSDLFHPAVPSGFIDRVFASMVSAGPHVFQVLTKRPERMASYMESGNREMVSRWKEAAKKILSVSVEPCFPPEGVWLGTSVESREVTHRIDSLRKTAAEVRFVSLEPLIGPLPNLDLEGIDWVIVGGESGHSPRPMKKRWVVDILKQCQEKGVPFFFKQWGGSYKDDNGRKLNGKIWNEMPSVYSILNA
jgi:protein gp37